MSINLSILLMSAALAIGGCSHSAPAKITVEATSDQVVDSKKTSISAEEFDEIYGAYCQRAYDQSGGGTPYRNALQEWYAEQDRLGRVPVKWKMLYPDSEKYLTGH